VRREALSALADGTPRLVRIVSGDAPHEVRRPGELTLATTCPSGGSLEVFVEPRLPRPLLVVFGASPAAGVLVEMGALAGFRTCAVHPGARPDDFRADLVLSTLDLAAAAPGADTWAVVATMGHYDEDALEAALAYPGVEVSLVASERRAAAVLEVLRSRGLDEAALARVQAPAGRVRAGTQAEIALFALADLVARRRQRAPSETDAAVARIFAVDPVCGMTVDVTGPARRTAGAAGPVYFCGPGCQEQFERDPERYASLARPASSSPPAPPAGWVSPSSCCPWPAGRCWRASSPRPAARAWTTWWSCSAPAPRRCWRASNLAAPGTS